MVFDLKNFQNEGENSKGFCRRAEQSFKFQLQLGMEEDNTVKTLTDSAFNQANLMVDQAIASAYAELLNHQPKKKVGLHPHSSASIILQSVN